MKKVLFAAAWGTSEISSKFGIPEDHIINLILANQQGYELIGLAAIRDFIEHRTENIGCAVILNPYRWKEMTSSLYAYLKLSKIPMCLAEYGWVGDAEKNKAFLTESTLRSCKQYSELRNYIDKMTKQQISDAKMIQNDLAERKQTNIIDQEETVSALPQRYIHFPMHIEWHDYNNNGYKCTNEQFYRDLIQFVNDHNIDLVVKRHPHSHKWKYASAEEESYLSLLKSKVKKMHIFHGHIHDVMKNAIATVTPSNEKLIMEASITGSIIVTCGESTLDMSDAFIQGGNAYDGLTKAISMNSEQIEKIKAEQAKLIYYVINEIQSEDKVGLWIGFHLALN